MSKIFGNFYIWVFLVNSESVLLLAFVKYTLYSHCTENYFFFFFFFWGENPCFMTKKIVQNFLIFVYLFCPKNSRIDSRNCNSGTVGRRKLSDPLLNRIFNVLSIGVQHTLLFLLFWIAFGLKYLIHYVIMNFDQFAVLASLKKK